MTGPAAHDRKARPHGQTAAGRRHPRGMVLVHALVVVAALSALALALLSQADSARDRMATLRAADQAGLYLDAAARLAVMILEQDARDSTIDHLGEFWAAGDHRAPIDLGIINGQISDLQSRFNVTWLAAPDEAGIAARAAFERLAQARGIAPGMAARLADALDPGSVRQANAMARGRHGSRPRPGPLHDLAELRLVEGMTDADLARLIPVLSVLPMTSLLNANSVLPEVLAAFLPDVPLVVVRDALASRATTPYESVAEFHERLARHLSERALAALPIGRFAVGSDWFMARISAQLDNIIQHRTLVLHRQPPAPEATEGATVITLIRPEPEPE